MVFFCFEKKMTVHKITESGSFPDPFIPIANTHISSSTDVRKSWDSIRQSVGSFALLCYLDANCQCVLQLSAKISFFAIPKSSIYK